MSGGVAGDVDDLEGGDLVSPAEVAVDVVGGAGHGLGEELGHEVVGLALADELGVLGGGDVLFADPEGHAEALAHGVRGALVVRVGVRQGVR